MTSGLGRKVDSARLAAVVFMLNSSGWVVGPMAIVYSIDPSGLVRVTATGVVSPEEVMDFLGRLGADPAFRPAAPQFVDLRGMEHPASVGEVERIATAYTRMSEQFGGVRCAMLVDTPVMFGVARQFGTMVEGARVEAAPFTSEHDAWAWLRGERDPEPEGAPN